MNRVYARVITAVMCAASAATAEVKDLRVPLREGKLSLPQLSASLSQAMGLPAIEIGSAAVDLSGVNSSDVVLALNKALGEGCQVSVDQESLLIRYDTEKLPKDLSTLKQVTRVFTAEVDPEAAAAQAARFGLLLPRKVDPSKRTVLLLHGVDCTRDCLASLADLLIREGYQVAYYGYPDDQKIADSAADFTEQLIAVRETFPKMPIDVVAFSMGGLVARAGIEGDAYPGGVGRLILLAPPNHGSRWAHVRSVLEVRQQWDQWRHDPNWKWTWSITDGLGEAGGDLLPNSRFLKELNARPRRAGVKYTIINGNLHPGWKYAAKMADGTVDLVGEKVSGWIRADRLADKIRNHESKSDGPVSIESTRLAGVEDFVTLRADHNGLYQCDAGQEPAAWGTIKDRLGR